MKRRFTTLAAMLLLTGALVVGMLGIASAQEEVQEEVHEADGMWHKSDNGQVSFKITWKGVVHVRWQDWLTVVETTTDEMGEVTDAQETVSVDRWEVTATHATEDTRTKSPEGGPNQVRFGKPKKLTFGETYTIAVKGFDEDDSELGSQEVTIRPSHVSAPNPVTGLTLSAGDDNLSVNANWTAPEAGGTPKQYRVWVTNLDTGRARGKLIKIKQGSGGNRTLKTATTFDGLWPGEKYRVSVQTQTLNSRSKRGDGFPQSWQKSAWTHDTITMPAGDNPGYAKVEPEELIWEPVQAGEAAPPYVIGEPTAYVVLDGNAPGGRAKFDAPNECKDHTNHDNENFFSNEKNDEDAYKARRKAQGQERILDRERGELAKAIAAKQKYLDDTPEADRDSGKIAAFDQRISRHQQNIDAGVTILAGLVAKLETECARAYPAVETLTKADDRWYQVAKDKEIEKAER